MDWGDGMVIKLYKTESDVNVVDKVLTSEIALSEVRIRTVTEVDSPVFTVQSKENLEAYNYCYIERYGRYYWTVQEVGPADVWTFHCVSDPLMSFKEGIRNLVGTVDRQENIKNAYLVDGEYKSVAYEQIVTKTFPSGLTDDSIIMITTG